MPVLSTPRLYLREISPADAENAYLLNADPEVLQYTGDAPFEDIAAAKHFLENYDHYQKYQFGRWAVIRKTDEAFLGWCGLKYSPELDEYDIGYRFFKQYWNQGYATEAARACIDLGFRHFGLPCIVGRVMAPNLGSIKVLEKIGLSFYRNFDFDGQLGYIYKIDKQHYTHHK